MNINNWFLKKLEELFGDSNDRYTYFTVTAQCPIFWPHWAREFLVTSCANLHTNDILIHDCISNETHIYYLSPLNKDTNETVY